MQTQWSEDWPGERSVAVGSKQEGGTLEEKTEESVLTSGC